MMRRKTVVAGLTSIVLGTPLLMATMMYATEWHQRHCAERVILVIRCLRPGVTTEAEYLKAVLPFRSHFDSESADHLGNLTIGSQPLWMWKVEDVALPNALKPWLATHTGLETLFEVRPTIEDGILKKLFVAELQGEGHPHGGTVTMYGGRVQCAFPCDPQNFHGYFADTRKWSDDAYDYYIQINDRASEDQRSRALAFRFECFTTFHWCADGRRMLDPR